MRRGRRHTDGRVIVGRTRVDCRTERQVRRGKKGKKGTIGPKRCMLYARTHARWMLILSQFQHNSVTSPQPQPQPACWLACLDSARPTLHPSAALDLSPFSPSHPILLIQVHLSFSAPSVSIPHSSFVHPSSPSLSIHPTTLSDYLKKYSPLLSPTVPSLLNLLRPLPIVHIVVFETLLSSSETT